MRLGRAIATVAAWLALACGTLLDEERYQVVQNSCAELEVPVAGGCQRVGVAKCGEGFAPDERGGCAAIQPTAPCPSATFALPGVTECSVIGQLACSGDKFAPFVDEGQFIRSLARYVDPAALAGGDGTERHPFRTVAEALLELRGPTTIMLSGSTHYANLDLSRLELPVRFVGACAEQTALVGAPDQPVMRFGPNTPGSLVESLSISGGGAGIASSGTRDLELKSVWIHDVSGPGLLLEDLAGVGETSLDLVLIQDVKDVGISAHGVALHVVRTLVERVRPNRSGGRGLGIDLGASSSFTGGDPSTRTPGHLTLDRSAIAHSTQAALRVEESSAEISNSWLDDVASDELGFSRGIDARGSASRSSLPARVTVTGTLIQGVSEVGIKIWNADAELTNTTIRDLGDPTDANACRAAGISASFDLLTLSDAQLAVHTSSIQGAARAGIELLGGTALVDGTSILGQSAAQCGTAQNGGLLSWPSATGGTSLQVTRSRVADWRQGVTVNGSALSFDGSIVSCSERAIGTRGSSVAGSSLCGCNEDWRSCESGSDLGGPSKCVASGDTTCLRLCLGEVTSWTSPITNATVWAYDVPGVPSALTGGDGCVELPGVPRSKSFSVATSALGYAPGLAMVAPIDEPPDSPTRGVLIPLNTIGYFNAVVEVQATDLRFSGFVGVRVCATPRRLPDFATGYPGQGVCDGLPGVSARLTDSKALGPVFFQASDFPGRELTATEGADILFVRVAPGPQRVSLSAPKGKRMNCTPNRWGWDAGSNGFDIHAEPGFTVYGAEVVCELER